jgi:hypothetical protein
MLLDESPKSSIIADWVDKFVIFYGLIQKRDSETLKIEECALRWIQYFPDVRIFPEVDCLVLLKLFFRHVLE